MQTRTIIFALASLITLSAQAQMEDILGGRRPPPFAHPQGFYTVQMPRGWEAKLNKDGQLLAVKTAGDKAELTISMSTVPMNADTEMVAFNKGRSLQKLPHYQDGGGGRLKIGGKPASIHSFAFDYQGNTEFTVAVEELYIVSGTVLFTVHFEVLKRSMPAFRKDLATFYDTLKIAEIDATGQAIHANQQTPTKKKRPSLPQYP